jgi:GNAT superfamily N-acetyltransferase
VSPDVPVTIRLAGPADDAVVAQLLHLASPGNPKADLRVLRWQYRREHFGPTVSVVAEAGGTAVAHYAAVAVPLAVNGEPVPAVHGADLAVHPEHRGRGLARAVARRLLVEARAEGYEAIVSNLNDRSVGALTPLGWRLVGLPRVRAVLISGAAISARWGAMPSHAADSTIRAVSRLSRGRPVPAAEAVPDLPEDLGTLPVEDVVGAGISRSERWWIWRYQDHPDRPYRFVAARRQDRLVGVGVLSWRRGAASRVGQLLELSAVDDDAARRVARGMVDLADREGAGAVVAAGMAGTPGARRLARCGFWPVPRRLQPRPVRLLVAELGEHRRGLADQRWGFQLGDQDHL